VTEPLRDTAGAWSALDPQIAEYVRTVWAPSLIPIEELTAATARQRTKARLEAASPAPPVHAVVPITLEVDGHTVRGRLYKPVEAATWVIVYFHGGGWVTGDLDTADGLARRLAERSGADVVSVDYRLAPEHQFPAAVDDAAVAVQWSRAFARDRPLAVAGDSAGGNLAAVCSQGDLAVVSNVRARLLIYPVLDADLGRASYTAFPEEFPLGEGIMAWYWDQYVPDLATRSDWRASPLRSAELASAAPTLLVLASHDPLVDEGREYAAALREAGAVVRTLEYAGTVHGFVGLPCGFSVSDRALTEACVALRQLVFSGSG
jgi:acetyl esterase